VDGSAASTFWQAKRWSLSVTQTLHQIQGLAARGPAVLDVAVSEALAESCLLHPDPPHQPQRWEHNHCSGAGQVAQGQAETAQQDQHAEVGGWRTNLYGPRVTTVCSWRTTTVVVKSRPRVSTAHSRRTIPIQATVSPAITHKTGFGRARVWCNASTNPAAKPPTIPAVTEK